MDPQEEIALLRRQKAGLQAALDATSATADALAAAQIQIADLTAERDGLAAQVEALTPPAGSLIPVEAFRERIAPAYLRLGTAEPAVQAKWDRIRIDFFPPSRSPVNLLSPTTAAMVAVAIADGLLTQGEADAVLAVG